MMLSLGMVMVALAGEDARQLRAWPVSEPISYSIQPDVQGGSFVLLDDDYGLHEERRRNPVALDGPELLGTVKPGLGTWLNEIRTGQRRAVDYSDYYLHCDPYARLVDRQHGIYYRDPYPWP